VTFPFVESHGQTLFDARAVAGKLRTVIAARNRPAPAATVKSSSGKAIGPTRQSLMKNPRSRSPSLARCSTPQSASAASTAGRFACLWLGINLIENRALHPDHLFGDGLALCLREELRTPASLSDADDLRL